MSATEPPVAIPPPAPPALPMRQCENCGTVLLGEHCHACGQPIKGLVRRFSSVFGDFLDTVFNIDSRVLRTIGPLLTRPGFLSLEYFAGRRVRYVTPMRLFLFLSLVAFFAIQGSIEINENQGDVRVGSEKRGDSIDKAMSVQEVESITEKALAGLEESRTEVAGVPGGTVGIEMAMQKVRDKSRERISYLRSVEAARSAGKPIPTEESNSGRNFNFPVNGKQWDPKTNPLSFSWLPRLANEALNRRMAHARDVLKTSNNGKPLVDALFNVLPQTLIVLMPVFALMLKVAYWFKRRLYMEHLIVALHSHSFISLALTILLLFSWLQGWLAPDSGLLNVLLGWAMALTGLWIPVYLLLMQRRVYGQGWPMTLFKYSVLGVCYCVMLAFGLMGALLVGLLTL